MVFPMGERNLVGVVTAMEEEAAPFLERISASLMYKDNTGDIYSGNYRDTTFAVTVAGIGKALAAAGTQHLIDFLHFSSVPVHFQHILHLGVGGALDSSLQIGEIILASKIIDLLLNPEKAKTFGEAGYERVKSEFNVDRMLSDYLSFYE